LKDATGWTAEHEAKVNAPPEETYNQTFRDSSQAIADSTSTPATNIVKAEDSVLDNDEPVVEVMKDDNPLASGSSSSSGGDPGTDAPRHLAKGISSYYRSRFG
jgi:hypothetical protein